MNNSLTESEPVEDITIKDDGEIRFGVSILDKAVRILDTLESSPSTLGQFVATTGLARPAVHRLAIILRRHRFVLRDQHGRFTLGSRFVELAVITSEDRLLIATGLTLQTLLDRADESVQIYRRQGDQHVCIAVVERTSDLCDSIPVGAMLSMEADSTIQTSLIWENSGRLYQGLCHAKFAATRLTTVHKHGWSESVSEHKEGVCSVPVPTHNASGQVIVAISISDPTGRMDAALGHHYVPLMVVADKYLTEALVKTVR